MDPRYSAPAQIYPWTDLLQEIVGLDRVVGIGTFYGLDRPGIEPQWIRDIPHPWKPTFGPTEPHTYSVPFIPEVKQLGVNHKPNLGTKLRKEQNYTSNTPHCLHSRLRVGLHSFLQEATLRTETKTYMHFCLFILTLHAPWVIFHVTILLINKECTFLGIFYMMKPAQLGQRSH